MKKKARLWINRAISAGLAVAMLPAMWSSAAGKHDGKLTDRVTHSQKSFKDYDYERMDEKDFDEIIDGLDDLAADAGSADAVLDVIIAMEDYSNEIGRNYSIAHIHSDLVAEDQYWDDEVKFWDELATSVGDKIMKSYRTIATSVNSDVLHDRVDDEDDWQEILDYVDMTQEQKDLNAKETELSLEYDILSEKEYKTTVGGKKYTKQELMDAHDAGSLDQDKFYTGYADLMKQQNKEMAELYIELVKVRTDLAKSYGYDNYADYAYDRSYDRDYTYKELDAYRKDIKDYLIPAQDTLTIQLFGYYYDQLQDAFDQKMTVDESLDVMRKYLPEISSDMLVSLDYMIDHDLYDLEVNDKKAPGGYTMMIQGYNAPFMYNDADGTYSDMRTVIHEFGHYNQMYYMTEDSWYYGNTDLDLAEIHSQGLELLFMDYSDDIFGDYSDLMNLYTIYNLVGAAVEGAKEDQFQYSVYSDPDNLTVEKLNQLYYDACQDYAGQYSSLLSDSLSLADQGYLDKGQVLEWVRIPHTFQSPMYYISYSVSVAAVFELFDCILNDRDQGIDMYLSLVDAEFQEGFQDTLGNVGLNNPISNPRYDVYAADALYYLGLQTDRIDDGTYSSGSGTDDGTEIEPTPTEAEDEPEATGKPDKDKDNDDDEEDDDDEIASDVGVSTGVIIALAIIGVLFVAVLIILIVLLIKRGKENKAQKYAGVPGGPVAPGGYVPGNGQPGAGAPGMPGRGAFGGAGGMGGNPGMGAAGGMNAASGMGGAGGMGGAPGMPGNPGMPAMNRPVQQGNPYMQGNNQPMQQGNPYMQGNNQPMQQSNPYMQGNNQPMQQGNPYMQGNNQPMQQGNPYMQNNIQSAQPANPYLQGNPFAGYGINNPANTQQPQPQQTVNTVTQTAPAAADNASQTPGYTMTEPEALFSSDEKTAAQSGAETVTETATEATNETGTGTGNGSDAANPVPSAPAQMGPQADDRPAPGIMGALNNQMPNTAPNPFLQNLENMKKDEGGSDNT